jgi:hypothetical protein
MEDEHGRIDVALPQKVRRDQALMRRLHHRVVDLLFEKGRHHQFAADVEEYLSALSVDIVSDYVVDLLKECESPKAKSKQPNGKNDTRRAGSNGRLPPPNRPRGEKMSKEKR